MLGQMNGDVTRGIMATRERQVTKVDMSEAVIMAKKKGAGERKTLPVRIDAQLVRRAQNVARDRGLPLSDYVTEILRTSVERDWSKILRRIASDEEKQ